MGLLAAARAWPADDPAVLPHSHDDLPHDHPHIKEHPVQDGYHAHPFVVDALHRVWPG